MNEQFGAVWRRVPRNSVLAIAVACALSGTAAAQQSAPAPVVQGGLEEVVVTGTKREESSQSVPIAISAISAKDLESAHVNDVRALQNLAPGLVLSNPAGFNATGGGMRGTGTNIILVTQDAPVSFLVDEFALSHVTSQFVSLFDTQQVEVYRGPQGTLFGKNTTGGVISITSKKPIIGEYGLETSVQYGQYRNGANAQTVQAGLNVPLGEHLAMRLAAIYDRDDGYYESGKRTATFPNDIPFWGLLNGVLPGTAPGMLPPGTKPPPELNTNAYDAPGHLGGKNVLAAKVKFLWEPTDWYTGYLIFEGVKDRSDSPPGVNESVASDLITLLGFPGIQLAGQTDPFKTAISHNSNIYMDQGHKVDTQGVYLTQTFQVPHGEIKSITGYRAQQQKFPSTYTGEAFQTLFDSTRNTTRHTTQQEFRFVSKLDGPFNFVTGANYFHDSFDFMAVFSVGLTSLIPNFNPATGTFLRTDGYANLDLRAISDFQTQITHQSRNEYALYWDGTYEVTDKFHVTVGARYSKDKKDFVRGVDGGGPCTAATDPADIQIINGNCTDTRSQYLSRAGLTAQQVNGFFSPLPFSAYGHQVVANRQWSKTTYRVVLDYKPADDAGMFYLSYATGFLSGGYSETCATVTRCSYNPETNKNLEFGYKGDLLNKTLRFNAAIYSTKYSDLQRAVVANYIAADGTSQQETVTVNTGTSKATGVDLETVWVPNDTWKVDGAVNYLHHKYGGGSCLPDLRSASNTGACNVDLTQFDLPFSPKFKANLGVTYTIGVKGGGKTAFNVNGNYQGVSETDVFNGLNTQQNSRTLLGAAITYTDPNDRWSATLYGTNLTDKIYRVAALPVAGLWNFTNYGAPRQVGVTLDAKFK
jgi:iron complex outermembrane receptor protein